MLLVYRTQNTERHKITRIYSMFFTGRQKVFAHSSGLKDFYDLKHVAFFALFGSF